MSERKPRKPRVVTEATKAKLPRPKRKRKPTLTEAANENLRESLRLSERLAEGAP